MTSPGRIADIIETQMMTRRIIFMVLVSLPAMLFGGCSITQFQGEYFWLSYVIASLAYFASGIFLALALPEFGRAWLRIFVIGGLAWGCAALVIGLTSLTPLCIGQDNGDGINNLGLCVGQTVLAVAIYTPGIFLLLGFSAFVGSKVLK
jgi:hypothetical protein